MPTFQDWLVRRSKTSYGLISNALDLPIGCAEHNPSEEIRLSGSAPGSYFSVFPLRNRSGKPGETRGKTRGGKTRGKPGDGRDDIFARPHRLG